MLVGDHVEDYEVMMPFQALMMVGHQVHAACPGKRGGELVRRHGVVTTLRLENLSGTSSPNWAAVKA
jgi:putative intracellular protease/amidase